MNVGVTFGVVEDADEAGRPPMQVVVTLSEAKTMLRMDGGICWENWLRIRGLDIDGSLLDQKES